MKFEKFSASTVMDGSMTMYPSVLSTHAQGATSYPDPTSTYYGVVLDGVVELGRGKLPGLSLVKGMYFSCPGPMELKGSGEVVVIRRYGYRSLFNAGGPVEEKGRLTYIDNCSTSIIIPPARKGDPVFNLLVFPPNTEQTMHIHPTLRMGVVLEGSGQCITPKAEPMPLHTKMLFYLEENKPHCFYSGKEKLVIIAYHPDSDVGPTDENHPMLSRTFTKF